jgi:hypothetical protein
MSRKSQKEIIAYFQVCKMLENKCLNIPNKFMKQI